MKKIAIVMVRIYQKTISPDHSALGQFLYPTGFCPYSPSCSQYMIDSINQHGLFKGFFKGSVRILKCNPWNTKHKT